jgi:hypothetical protein
MTHFGGKKLAFHTYFGGSDAAYALLGTKRIKVILLQKIIKHLADIEKCSY